jgi:AraC-like DNA-binding protein
MRLASLPSLPSSVAPPLWPPLLATRGPGARSAGHAHHALHVVIALEGELRVRAGPFNQRRSRPWQRAAGVITAPDAPHAIDAAGREVLLVFLDPESQAGLSLRAILDGPLRLLPRPLANVLAREPDPLALMRAEGSEWTRQLVALLGGGDAPVPAVHPRVRRVLRALRDSPGDDVSLPSLARAAGLSEGRFMHAFTTSIGIPLRPYLLWLKLQRAAAAVAAGTPLSDAAAVAGFADAAHMSRTFRRMLGLPPSALRAQMTAS